MDMVNVENAEETYSKYHKDTLIEEYLQKRTDSEVEKILLIELEKRNISLEKIEQFVKENELDAYPNGMTYANLALRTNRVMAYLIDSFYIFCLYIAMSLVAWIMNIDYAITTGITMLIYWFYFLIKDALPNGQSFGKKSMQLKVVSSKTGNNCTVVQSIIRNIVNFIPFLNIADALFAGRYKRQRIGDILARTIVIDDVKK
jgi:uncharacterized RDD family membrane protein YckC